MNTRTTFESAIVRLLTTTHEPVGVGFLVDANHIVTCAHVINDALYRTKASLDIPLTKEVCFNLLQANRDHVLTAKVSAWDHEADIAVLEFYEQLPVGVTPQIMLDTKHVVDHDFDAYGVPPNYDDGVWISGVLRSAVSGGHIQIVATNNVGHFIAPGFSGSPVWDKTLGAVVGIVVTADRDTTTRTAFIIPTEQIRQAWPALPSVWIEKQESSPQNDLLRYESPYGTVPVDSHFYIERRADPYCLSEFVLVSRGTVYIQAPRQMGKSSLMQRTLYKIKETQSIQHVFIDFHRFQKEQLTDLKNFLVVLCKMFSNRFNISEPVEQYWLGGGSDLDNCSNFIQSVLSQLSNSVIIALDEVDRVLGKPWQDDFFGMLRTWHEEAAYDPDFRKLRLFLSSSTEPHLFIENPNQSPFNIVKPIELDDFTPGQIHELIQLHKINLGLVQETALLTLLDGHPCLTRIALYQIALKQYNFDSLIRNATGDNGPFGDHLKHLRNRVLEIPELRNAIKQICKGQSLPIGTTFFRLKGAGLVKLSGNQVVMRNQLYEQYFKHF